MNIKKFTFVLGWGLIIFCGLGLLGIGTSSIQIPKGAKTIDNYSYVQPLPNGQYRLTIHAQPRNSFFLFDIMDMQTDSRRYTVNNSVPDSDGEGSMYAVNKVDSAQNHCIRNAYCEFNFRTESIESITYATLHFKASTIYSETVWLEVYQCDNIDHTNINWYNQPARGQNPLETFIVPAETHPDGAWESFQLDVTDEVLGEFSQDKIATFGFFAQDQSGFAYIARHNIDPFPVLTIDYTPATSGGSSGTSDSYSDNYINVNPDSPEKDSTPLDRVISGPGFHLWPILGIIIGIILVGYSSNGRFFR